VVSTQKGVDTSFTSTDLTLDLQDFSKRILEPAMAVLAANIEADAFNMLDDVYQVEDRSGSSVQFSNVLNTRKLLRDSLAPMNDNKFIMDTQANVDLVDALKGLFQDSSQIAKQYREGMIGRTANFEFFENTLLPAHTTGGWNANYDIKTAPSSGDTTLDIDTGTGTIKKGDVFTIAGINRVHPETKADTGVLQQFVATADSAGGDVEIGISPAIISTSCSWVATIRRTTVPWRSTRMPSRSQPRTWRCRMGCISPHARSSTACPCVSCASTMSITTPSRVASTSSTATRRSARNWPQFWPLTKESYHGY
jgi:hypothetical protein